MSETDFAGFKALCAALGVQTYSKTDAFGRPDIAVDREGLNKLIAAGVLPEDPADLMAHMEKLRKRLEEGE
ncbi:hypothetical protein [Streptomyces sp. NPDC058664]|uniref:hypothetical protein n=1 Tax=unclassified Streptomyces TaxID=2593676 RepID=UPI003654385D